MQISSEMRTGAPPTPTSSTIASLIEPNVVPMKLVASQGMVEKIVAPTPASAKS